MICRLRVINLRNKKIWWKHPPEGYIGAYCMDDPQMAIMFAECLLEVWGDQLVSVVGVDLLHDEEEDLGGILIKGRVMGVLVEGAELL